MPNLNVGLGLTVITPALAARDTYFYNIDGSEISGDAVGNSNSSLYLDLNGCAYAASDQTNAYSCNGTCSNNLYSNKIIIPPNGSYFWGSDDKIYTCTVTGWKECVVNPYAYDEFTEQLAFHIYNYNQTGYKIIDMSYGSMWVSSAANFCLDPYEALDSSSQDIWTQYGISSRNFYSTTTLNDQEITIYEYSGCAPGYYLKNYGTSGTTRGYRCVSCPDIANGNATTTTWNSASSCTVTCDPGYVASGQSCVALATSGYNPYNYGSDDDCRGCLDCPDGAMCDGEYVYCPVGSYVFADYNSDGIVMGCVDCPGERGFVDAFYDSSLQSCSGVSGGGYPPEQWGIGIDDTDCLWTDSAYSDSTDCKEYIGSDITGSYEYRNDVGDREYCNFQD